MALSLAQRCQLRKRAAQEAAATAPEQTMSGATTYELQLYQLAQDRARLKQIQSQQGKQELKRQILPAYIPYVSGVLSAGRGAQDDVVSTVMLWRIDAGDYEGALDIAGYVIEHGLKMPDRFERTTGCLVAEEVADAALNAQKAGKAFDLDVLVRTGMTIANQDMPDQVQAKLLLATGRAHAELVSDDERSTADRSNLETAKRCISGAIELHSSCGGKKDLERVERLIKKLPEVTQDPEPPAVAQGNQGAAVADKEQVPADPPTASSGESASADEG